MKSTICWIYLLSPCVQTSCSWKGFKNLRPDHLVSGSCIGMTCSKSVVPACTARNGNFFLWINTLLTDFTRTRTSSTKHSKCKKTKLQLLVIATWAASCWLPFIINKLVLLVLLLLNKSPVNHVAIMGPTTVNTQEDGNGSAQLSVSWCKPLIFQLVKNRENTAWGHFLFFFFLTLADLFVISFTFRGIITFCYWDLHRVLRSVTCPPYENWSNYWLDLSTAGKKREWINSHFDE